MSIFKHVLHTWLLSHVFHPFLFCLSMYAIDDAVPAAAVPILIIAGPIVSIPSLLLSWMFLSCLQYSNKVPLVTQGLWMLLVPVAILLNLFILLLLAGITESLFETPSYILPAIVSSWIAILARTTQFQHLFTFKTLKNEDRLV